ncbi:NUDIX domain-containing protein [Galactobacter sp.]|uniref:NUDIX hydrolase n=1 Tax=Galactobacter sp. TaxID=2676125 RepID=UPI0025BD9DEB|nr:NUDIX domain-containing protein [Galactobacter sp.]
MTREESPAQTLETWSPQHAVDRALWSEYVSFAQNADHAFRELSVEQHLTSSAFVFDAELENILLCFHGKGRFWVQFGGHIETSDASLAAAAQREGLEESGLTELTPLLSTPVDLDRHSLSQSFGTCRVHWDVGYAFTADRAASLQVSDESESVAWWPLGGLPEGCVQGLAERIDRVVDTVRKHRSDHVEGRSH